MGDSLVLRVTGLSRAAAAQKKLMPWGSALKVGSTFFGKF